MVNFNKKYKEKNNKNAAGSSLATMFDPEMKPVEKIKIIVSKKEVKLFLLTIFIK